MAVKAAITIESLKETHGSRANDVYDQIAQIGGFGQVGNEFVAGKPSLDINGCSEEKLAEIEKILAHVKKTDDETPVGNNAGNDDDAVKSDDKSDEATIIEPKKKEGKK